MNPSAHHVCNVPTTVFFLNQPTEDFTGIRLIRESNRETREEDGQHTAANGRLQKPNAVFEGFPRLPLELREMIWKHALPGPRLVELRLKFQSSPQIICSAAPIPAMLHTSYEARAEAQKHYKLCFANMMNGIYDSPRVWFSSHIDVLYLGVKANALAFDWGLQERLNEGDRRMIRHVALDTERNPLPVLTLLPNLESLELARNTIEQPRKFDIQELTAYVRDVERIEFEARIPYGIATMTRMVLSQSDEARLRDCQIRLLEYRRVSEDFENTQDHTQRFCPQCVADPDHVCAVIQGNT